MRTLSLGIGLTVALLGWAWLPTAQAADKTPVGYWKTIDDDGKTEKSVIRIYEQNGKIKGKIVKLINPEKPNPKCTECSGSRKDQPITGMVVMWDLAKDDEGDWSGGRILDPANGEDYKCYLTLEDEGKKLKVRGYVGMAIFGRTQYWYRTSAPKPAAPKPAAPKPLAPKPEE